MPTTIKILDQDFVINCAEQETRRLEDLAQSLDSRLKTFSGNEDDTRRLVLTALALLDEVQTTRAALVRAQDEIERLTDMVVEARLEAEAAGADTEERGGVSSLRRVAEGAA
jgi:cell division protein ZapA (FtsZ GTPase activity inhibitor)